MNTKHELQQAYHNGYIAGSYNWMFIPSGMSRDEKQEYRRGYNVRRAEIAREIQYWNTWVKLND